MTPATTRMNLKDVMLSEIRQTQKINLAEATSVRSQRNHSHRDRQQDGEDPGLGRGMASECLTGPSFSVRR